MKKIVAFVAAALSVITAALALPKAVQAAPPQYFQSTPIITTGLNGPSGFEIAPDGRIFILQRTGEVKIYKNGQLLANNFITLPSIASGDRGLIGIAFDPDYSANKYVYFYYTALDKLNYLVRFSAASDTASDGPVIIYHTTSPSEQLHVGGGIDFGSDGKLYFTVGDNGYPPNAQSLDNPHGKILRINKDGSVPSDNPFVNTPGALPEIWAYGLRNPWRLQFDDQTGFLYDGDVGNNTWEEVNRIQKGKNYGWPTCEGTCNTAGMTNPIYTYNHDGVSSAVTGGPIYRSTMFPQSYVGRYFFGDYARGFIKTMGLDASGNMTNVNDFDLAAGSVVDLRVAPDGSMYYITYYPGRLYRITYSTTNQVPSASAGSDATKGLAPFTVHFTSAGSSDPDNNPLSFFWDFGDGQTSTTANPTHTYTNTGSYLAQLTVSDGTNTVDAVPVVIQVGLAPTVTIGTPANNSTYKAGDTITYSVSAIDGVGNDMNDSKIGVEILFHHLTHIHPFLGPLYGRNGSFTIPQTGEPSDQTWFEIKATATDTNGLSTTKSSFIYPQKSNLTFQTNPAGLQINLDGEPTNTPQTITHVVGFKRELSAPTPQYIGSDVYELSTWSDGGAKTHLITTPNTNTTYTANFIKTGTVVAFNATYYNNKTLSGAPVLTRADALINFDWGTGSPDPAVAADNFSARWVKSDTFNSGDYKFTVAADDGVRLFVDNALVIDKWIDQSTTEYTVTLPMSAGIHEIKMEYYDGGYDAVAKLSWTQTSGQPAPTPTPLPGNSFAGQYYNNMTLSGNPVLSRNDASINFTWGAGSPDVAVQNDNFSARWTQNVAVANSSTYQFTVTADDGVRLKIDGNVVLDKWIDQPPTQYVVPVILEAGNHVVVMEYYENGWDATAKLSWASVQNPAPTPTPMVPTPTPAATGFTGEYWNFNWTANPQIPATPANLTRNDAAVNFDWGQGNPGAPIGNDNFIARWTKAQNFAAGSYKFSVTADDGVRLFIDNNLVIDKWQLQGATTYTSDQTLTSGNHVIRMEYYEHEVDASAKLSWTQIAIATPTPTVAPSADFSGQYFNNTTLSGNPVLTRNDATINFDWGGGNPGGAVQNDNFSARWTKTAAFTAGDYTFTVTADDGVRLKLDGQTIIDQWIDQSAKTYTTTKTLTAGNHTIVVEYYENTGDAVAKASWAQINTPTPTPVVPTPTPAATGFTGEYWNFNWTANPQIPATAANLTRNDTDINFNWGQGTPGAPIGNDNFIARWTKTQSFASGTYRFSVTADDGVRLYVDNAVVIDKWQLQGATTYTSDQTLTSGNHVIRMEYYEHEVDASAKLSWVQLASPTPVVPTPTPIGPTPTSLPVQSAFSAQYFDNMTLSGTPTVERLDNAINFDWGYQSPDVALQYDFFSARWVKSEVFQGGTYRFAITSDDGLRIKIDGNTVYDQWFDQAPVAHTVDIQIAAGTHTIVVEYYENDLTAVCQVSWALLP